MIEFSRSLARQFRAVLRRSLLDLEPRGSWPLLLCQLCKDGLVLQACQGDLAVRYQQKAAGELEALAFRSSVLAEFEGRGEEPVTLEQVAVGKGRARWNDRGTPRAIEFETVTPNSVPGLPALPGRFAALPPTFLEALAEAGRVTAKEGVRFALTRVQMRGRQGEVVATDGRQMLLQRGFPLPWQDDVLVPRLPVLGSKELPEVDAVGLGRTKTHVVLRVGPWAFFLKIDTAGRYPNVSEAIPRLDAKASRLRIDPEDAAFLLATLPKLPGRAEDNSPVTLDSGPPVAVRARAGDGGPVTEAVLTRSTTSGPTVRLSVNRSFLQRALALGFPEIGIAGADKPLVCRYRDRLYVWMGLGAQGALPPDPRALKLTSEGAPAPCSSPDSTPSPERRIQPMPASNGQRPENGQADPQEPERWTLAHVIAEAEALRGLLHEAGARTARLLAALKQQRRHSGAVQQAMQSLKQLQLDR
jgi:hypothetical protein